MLHDPSALRTLSHSLHLARAHTHSLPEHKVQNGFQGVQKRSVRLPVLAPSSFFSRPAHGLQASVNQGLRDIGIQAYSSSSDSFTLISFVTCAPHRHKGVGLLRSAYQENRRQTFPFFCALRIQLVTGQEEVP